MRVKLPVCTVALCLVAACGGDNTASTVEAPGAPPDARTRTLEAGAAILQDKAPLDALDSYVDGFHFANGDLERQVEAHHYCSSLTADVRQCVIFDGNGRDAKLTGVEYIVSRRVFESLPVEERKLWHSHGYEVTSGLLVAPGIPDVAEHELMEDLAGTYGKTWHTWHTGQGHALPTGHPLLMAGFTADGQVDDELVAARDRRFSLATGDKRKLREDIRVPDVIEGADAWQQGEVLQLRLHSSAPAGDVRPLPQTGREDASGEPTRKLRPHKLRELYANLGRDDG